MTLAQPAFHFSTVVFGEPFTTWFLEAALPSELSPGNLPAMLRGSRECRYHIYTSSSDEAVIDRHPASQRLQQLVPVEYHLLDETLVLFKEGRLNQYDIMGQAYSDTASQALAAGALVVPLWADGVFSDGSFARLLELAQSGIRVVAIFGNQASCGAFVPALRRAHFDPDRHCITATARALNALYLAHISPNWAQHYLNSGHFPDLHPAFFAWKVGDEGVLVRSMTFHPLLAAPRPNGTLTPPTLGAGTDASQYFSDVCSDFVKELYVVADTDDICFVSLDDRARFHPRVRQPNTVKMAASITRRVWPHTRFFLEHKLRFHTKGFGDGLWKAAEAESDRFFADLWAQVEFFEAHPDLYADVLRLAVERPAYTDLINNEFLIPRLNNLVAGWQARKSRVVVYGAANHTLHLGVFTNLNHANVVGLADGNAALHGKDIMGFRVIAPSEIPALSPDVVLISSAGSQEIIYDELQFLERLGIQVVRIYYEP